MDDLSKFLSAVRRHWGSLVTGGAAIGLLGIYQGVGHPVKPWVYWTIAAIGLVVSFFLAWRDEHKSAQIEVDKSNALQAQLDTIPLKLTIVVEDLFRRASFETHAHLHFDFFLSVCIRLLGPSSIVVDYALEVIAPTSTLPSYQVLDMNLWAMTKFVEPDPFGTTAPPILYALSPLPTLLELGHPVNGWLHFRTEGLLDSDLLKCRLRILAKSSHGTEFFDVDLKSRPFFRKDFKIILVKDEEAYLDRSLTNPLPPTV